MDLKIAFESEAVAIPRTRELTVGAFLIQWRKWVDAGYDEGRVRLP